MDPTALLAEQGVGAGAVASTPWSPATSSIRPTTPALTDTLVTLEGVEQLRSTLPKLHMVYGVRPLGGVPVRLMDDK